MGRGICAAVKSFNRIRTKLLVHLLLLWGGVQQRLGVVLCHTKLAAHYALSAWCNCEAEKFARLDTIYRESQWRMQGLVCWSARPCAESCTLRVCFGANAVCSVRFYACHCYRTEAQKKSILRLIQNALAHMRQSIFSSGELSPVCDKV